jgi:phosphopantothenoylcysteine decarboxylase / phosphopantothenate---cysteine ligase
MKIFREKTIILGVSGSIAAYKAASLASRLQQDGAQVHVVMTTAATHFVGPMTFESLTHREVVKDVLAMGMGSEIMHVALANRADLMLIAPATANTIARLAHGFADDPISAIALATHAPILVAPAMETGMWEALATQDNLATLRARGITIVEPASGHLASGSEGKGRLAEIPQILSAARTRLAAAGSLAGTHVIITAGGTREPIDPVRVLTNLSSGRMGLALADEALERGARVSYITASENGELPLGAQVMHVGTTEEMCAAVLEVARGADMLIMAAAPADFRAAQAASAKIKKDKSERLVVEFIRNPDILERVARLREREPGAAPRMVVGFAAETEDLIQNARQKLESKRLDMIVANPVPQTFASDRIEAVLLQARGEIIELEPMTKERLAQVVFDRIESALA